MKILYAGELSTLGSNCFLRMLALQHLGYHIIPFDFHHYRGQGVEAKIQFHFGWGRNINQLNRDFLQLAKETKPDLIWVDKGIFLRASTLQTVKQIIKTQLMHLVPDDPFGHNRKGWRVFYKAIPEYDLHFVKRPYNIAEYKNLGAKKVFEYDHSYDNVVHRPVTLTTEADKQKYKAAVGFVGTYEFQRADSICYLIENGVSVAIWGECWHKYKHWNKIKAYHRGGEMFGDSYAKVLCGMDIALHFLRKANRDAQDSRTFEIPACGTFMLAERTYKHEQFFEDHKEAVFFDSKEDLLQKVRYYMQHEEERKKIAMAGYTRCQTSGYDHQSRLSALLELVKAELFEKNFSPTESIRN
jgi:spore maturation protein CgeB